MVDHKEDVIFLYESEIQQLCFFLNQPNLRQLKAYDVLDHLLSQTTCSGNKKLGLVTRTQNLEHHRRRVICVCDLLRVVNKLIHEILGKGL
ncbi:hypothetical protein MKW98_008046 [Papaver atlanticum]|uniref:Uncharacterized protein n=1 Tax=Papaver atlanticum TaxID=357466 RepID=A0AAD4XAQ6_9MAGN|nr:hypothetical protein MKW98_008046 [Papaver atlanticum]